MAQRSRPVEVTISEDRPASMANWHVQCGELAVRLGVVSAL